MMKHLVIFVSLHMYVSEMMVDGARNVFLTRENC